MTDDNPYKLNFIVNEFVCKITLCKEKYTYMHTYISTRIHTFKSTNQTNSKTTIFKLDYLRIVFDNSNNKIIPFNYHNVEFNWQRKTEIFSQKDKTTRNKQIIQNKNIVERLRASITKPKKKLYRRFLFLFFGTLYILANG